MSRKTKSATLTALLLALALALATGASAAAPAWQLGLFATPTNFAPGTVSAGAYPNYTLIADNVGSAATSGTVTVTVQLPSGVSAAAAESPRIKDKEHVTVGGGCTVAAQTVTCTDSNPIKPGKWVEVEVPLDIGNLPDPTEVVATATISGGGGSSATTQISNPISASLFPPGFLPAPQGLNSSAIGEDGSPATQAGSHPFQLNVNLSFPTRWAAGDFPHTDGTLHDTRVTLPAGLILDPNATPKCPEAQLTAASCPDSTQVGLIGVPLASGGVTPAEVPLYNVEAPPGYGAAFGFKLANTTVHILGGVHPGDYRLTSLTPETISVLAIWAARVQLWGSPSDASHDAARGACSQVNTSTLCPVSRSDRPLLSLPSSCSESMRLDAEIDLWESLGDFFERSALLSDANGNPTGVVGCSALRFAPTLKARPTTSVADSPTGLEVDVHVPQSQSLGELATAHLKDAVITLPRGMALNPSGANGLAGCSPSQVGVDPSTGAPDGEEVGCPAASRIGSVQVDTPLLDHPLPGSVYAATPYDNPFDSLLAIYIVLDDPASGTLVKLSGHVVADPQSGQLVTTFSDNPQLTFTDFKLDFFGGAYAALRTPAACGSYATTSVITPWSAPESGPPATPSDGWSIDQSPGGGCPASEASLPQSASFEAGSASPIAGAYTPFVLHLSRADGTQRFSAANLSPPPGLLAKLAGTTECSDAALAQAATKSGKAEQASPSCPASSRIGSVEVAVGAGPGPYHAQGAAYLTGPYGGAPLGLAIVTPATAGPYDLGTVVVRTAIHVDPVTTKITAVSDPIPQILQGIPLDIRSAQVSLDRPDFTLNGTSCDPSSVGGTLFGAFSSSQPLFARFQLGECGRLGFKPRLSIHLKGKSKRGGFPALRATYTPRAGDANLKDLVLRFPRSEFIEQGHFGTVCTRVQFASGAGNGAGCPAGSIYGQITAITPLLDQPLEGPVYLRSSSHNLPDVVFALNGKIDAEVAVRIDSVNGGLRASLEGAPDVPVSKVILDMQGGKKGLFVNSRDICAKTYRATLQATAQSAATYEAKPALRPQCKGKHKRKGRRARGAGR